MLVQGRGRLVQNQDFRVLNQCACDRNPLLLAARELLTFQATVLLESLAQADFTTAVVTHLLNESILQFSETLKSCRDADLTVLLNVVLEWLIRHSLGPLLNHQLVEAVLVRRVDQRPDSFLLIRSELITCQELLNFTSPLKVEDEIVPLCAGDKALIPQLHCKRFWGLCNLVKSLRVSFEQDLEH